MMEFDGFQKDNVHWKALKIDFFDAVVAFPTTKIAKKNTKVPKHVQKYDLLCLKPTQSWANMDSKEWTKRK